MIFKTVVLINYWVSLDKLNQAILFKIEFLQLEIFGDKIISQTVLNHNFVGMKYFIFEIILENLILTFTLINICSQNTDNEDKDNLNCNNKDLAQNKNHLNDLNILNKDSNFKKNKSDNFNDEEKNMNNNSKNDLLSTNTIKNSIKSYLEEKFGLYAIQFLLIAILTLSNISLLYLPIFICLIMMMSFSITLPNSFNTLDRINKTYGFFSFLIIMTNYVKNSNLLKNRKEDYFIGVINFETNYSYTFFCLLYLSYINCLCIQYYDISDEAFERIEQETEKQYQEEKEQEKKLSDLNKNESISDKHQNNYSKFFTFYKDNKESDKDEISNFSSDSKNFFFLISPLLYKVILLIWILFHVCLIMFINFVILFFAIEKAKKYFKLYYLIPSFLVCVLFTILQYTFNMNGIFFFDNIKTYKILEIIGIYKIYKDEITDFTNSTMIGISNQTKFNGMLFNIFSMTLLYCFGIALNISSEDQHISSSKRRNSKKEYQTLEEVKNYPTNNDKNVLFLDDNFNKDNQANIKDNNIIANNVAIESDDINNKDLSKKKYLEDFIRKQKPNDSDRKSIINETLSDTSKKSNFVELQHNLEEIIKDKNKDVNSNQDSKGSPTSEKLKAQLKQFWVEKSYLLCIVITFVCSVIKFDLLHLIYFVYFIIFLCLDDKGFKPVWDNLMLINRIIIIIILYFWNILAVNFLELEKETSPGNENIFTYLGLKINKNSIFFVEYWEHILLYLFGYIHNYIVVYLYIYLVNNENKNNMNISIDNSLNSTYLENEKIASVKHIYRFPEWTRIITILLVVFLMVYLAFINPLSFQGLFIFVICLIFISFNLFYVSNNEKGIIRGFIKILIIISIISIVLKYCINFSFMVNYLKDLLNLEDFIPIEEKAVNDVNKLSNQNGFRSLNGIGSTIDEESLKYYSLGIYNSNNNDIENPNLKNFSLQDYGLDVKNFQLKLFINFLMILTMKILYSYNYYHQDKITKEDDYIGIMEYLYANKIKNSNNRIIVKTKEIFGFIKVFIYQSIYLHACKIMFLMAVFVCVRIESMIGVILFGVILITLFMERQSGWRYSFFPLVFISIIVMSFIYLCKMNAFKKWMTKDYEWFGLYNPKSSYIFTEQIPFIIILIFCYLSRISIHYKYYFTIEVVDKKKEDNIDEVYFQNYDSLDSPDKKDKNYVKINFNSNFDKKENLNEIENPQSISEYKLLQDEKKGNCFLNDNNNKLYQNKTHSFDKDKLENEKSTHMENVKQNEVNEELEKEILNKIECENNIENNYYSKNNIKYNSYNSHISESKNIREGKISFNEAEKKAILLFSKFWITLDFFWYLYGFYIVLITIMLIAFIKVNLLSLCLMIFVGYQSFGKYIRAEYISEKEENNKNNLKFLKKYWFCFAVFLSIFSFMQYINYMWFPPSWKIAKPWEHYSFFCSKEGKSIYSNNVNFKNNSDFDYCVTDWKAWLNIDNYSTKDIFHNFICLFMLLISNKYLTDEELPHTKREKFYPEKSNNFTIAENRKDFWDTLLFISFVYLKSLILFCIIIMSIVYTYKYTNIIYSGFMFISFYILFKESYLIKKKNELWKIVQFYNFLVLVFFMLFQTPSFPCPINSSGRSYVGLEECIEEENKLYKSFLIFEYPKFWADALYMVVVQTIGLLKLDFKLLVVGNLSLFIIYIVALIQQIIFDHPYQYFVDKYLEIEKNINCKSRAFKIVQDSHLKLKCEYRKIYTNVEILTHKLNRLNRKTTEYAELWDQKLFGENYGHQNKNNNSYNNESNKQNNNSKNENKNEDINTVEDAVKLKLKEEIIIIIENTLNENDLAGEVDYEQVESKVKDIIDDLKKDPKKLTSKKIVKIDEKINIEKTPKIENEMNENNMNKEHEIEITKINEEMSDENTNFIQSKLFFIK